MADNHYKDAKIVSEHLNNTTDWDNIAQIQETADAQAALGRIVDRIAVKKGKIPLSEEDLSDE